MVFVDQMEEGSLAGMIEAVENEKCFIVQRMLGKMVRAASKARELDEDLLKHGYSTTPFGFIFGEVADTIYCLIGEDTNRFEDSLTFIVLHTDAITLEAKVEILMKRYRENHP